HCFTLKYFERHVFFLPIVGRGLAPLPICRADAPLHHRSASVRKRGQPARLFELHPDFSRIQRPTRREKRPPKRLFLPLWAERPAHAACLPGIASANCSRRRHRRREVRSSRYLSLVS